jgi:hypothetical protein
VGGGVTVVYAGRVGRRASVIAEFAAPSQKTREGANGGWALEKEYNGAREREWEKREINK